MSCPQRGRPVLRGRDLYSEGATSPQRGDLSSEGTTSPQRGRPVLRGSDLSWGVDELNVLRTSCSCHGIGWGLPNGFPQIWLIRVDMYNVHVYFQLIRCSSLSICYISDSLFRYPFVLPLYSLGLDFSNGRPVGWKCTWSLIILNKDKWVRSK